MSSTDFGSLIISASCIVGTCNILCGRVFLNGRGPNLLFGIHTLNI